MDKNLKFKRTREAVAAYDAYDQLLVDTDRWYETSDSVMAAFAYLEILGRAVGRAYGEDTCDVNNPEMCEGCVRPNPWLRKMIGEES